jgi:hypothetical protein
LDSWVAIGRAVVQAQEISDTLKREKRKEWRRTTFQSLIEQAGLARVVDKSTATRLKKIMAKLPDVYKWYETLTERQKILYAAPTTILKYCPAFHDIVAAKTKAKVTEPKPPTRQQFDDASEVVEEFLDDVKDTDNRRAHLGAIVKPYGFGLYDLETEIVVPKSAAKERKPELPQEVVSAVFNHVAEGTPLPNLPPAQKRKRKAKQGAS